MTATEPRSATTATAAAGASSWLPVVGRRFHRHVFAIPDRFTALVISVATLVLTCWNITGAPTYQDDEGTYTAQAVSVMNGDFAPYTYWYDHPPFGWVQLAVVGWLPLALHLGGSDIGSMRIVIALFFTATTVLLFLIGRRIGLNRSLAIVASALFALSPLSLEFGRQVYLDSVAMPWLLLAFYFALSPRKALWDHVAAGVFFAVAVLSKETFAIFGPAVLLAMLDRTGWQARVFSVVGFLSVGGLVLAVYPLLAALRGELLSGPGHVSLQDGLAYQFLSRSGSGWLWEAGSARSALLGSWIAIDPVLMILGALAALACALSRRTRWITIALACFATPLVAGQGYLPAMYVMAATPFLALAIAAAFGLVRGRMMALADRMAPTERMRAIGSLRAAAVLAALPVLFFFWGGRDIALLTEDRNADWNRTLAWVGANVAHDDVVLVPYSMWQDLDKQGWNDPWTAVVVEKADLDSEFAIEHPGGWEEVQWVVEGPTVAPNIRYLGLTQAGEALQNSETVATFGDWSVHRVVVPASP